MTRRLLAFLLLAMIGVLFPHAVQAQAIWCQADTTPVMDFGRPGANPTARVDTVATPALRVTCLGTRGARVKVCVGIAAGTDNAISPRRRMARGNSRLEYQIYSDPSRTQIVGTMAGASGTSPLETTVDLNDPWIFGLGSGEVTIPLYGRIFAGQTPQSGTYQSTMNPVEIDSVASNTSCRGATGPLDSISMTAQAVVPGSCDIDARDLNFGNRSSLAANIDATSQIVLTCSPGTAYTVRLNGGTVGNNVSARKMGRTGSPSRISYQLSTNGDRSDTWGDGTSGTVVVTGTSQGPAQTLTVFGRVPGPQTTPAAGTYSDVVTATVEY